MFLSKKLNKDKILERKGKIQKMLREMLPDEVLYDIYSEYGYFIDTEDNTFFHNTEGMLNRSCSVDREKIFTQRDEEKEKEAPLRGRGLLYFIHTLSCVCVSLIAYQLWCV